jgi:hypothetical protein
MPRSRSMSLSCSETTSVARKPVAYSTSSMTTSRRASGVDNDCGTARSWTYSAGTGYGAPSCSRVGLPDCGWGSPSVAPSRRGT